MENAHKNDVNSVINQMQMIKFQGVFMAALDLLKKEPIILMALFLAPLVVNSLIEGYVVPPVLAAVMSAGMIVTLVVTILFGVLSALISFFGSGLLFRAGSQVFEGKKVDVGTIVAFVQKHFVEAIKLAIKLFIYTGGWIMIAYFAAAAILLPILPAVAGILAMLSPIAVIVYLIVFFKKIVNASLSYAVFWSAEAPTPESALKKSLELTEGITWTIFGNYFLMGLVGAVVSALLIGVLGAVLAVAGRFGVLLTSAIAAAVVGTFYAMFQYCLKGQVEKFRASGHATAHHTSSHSA